MAAKYADHSARLFQAKYLCQRYNGKKKVRGIFFPDIRYDKPQYTKLKIPEYVT